MLTNGNLKTDFNEGSAQFFSDIYETASGDNPQVVWLLQTYAQNAYRAYRMGSLYPGAQ